MSNWSALWSRREASLARYIRSGRRAVRVLLPHARFLDAYRLVVHEGALDARIAARRIFGQVPLWIRALMAVRNSLVVPLGLKTALTGASQRIGFFPVITETSERVLLGLDDKHLDFRIAVDVDVPLGSTQREITTTTLVRPHNLLGRIYLAIVLPFHRMIVPVMLAQASLDRKGTGEPTSAHH